MRRVNEDIHQQMVRAYHQNAIRRGQKARTFSESLWHHIRNGHKHVDQATRKARETICTKCEHYRPKNGKECALCGCRMPWKISWASSDCPDNPPRWEAVQ